MQSSERGSLMVVVPIVIMAMAMAMIVVVPAIVSIMPVIAACVVRLVFCRSYEVPRPIAGVVLSAMLGPILFGARPPGQVDRRWRGCLRLPQNRFAEDTRA